MTAQLALPGAPPPPKASLSQWDSPRDLATQVARFAQIKPKDKVLEPSAGLGSLAIAARNLGADVFCVEIDPDRVALLEAQDFPVLSGDFLGANLCDSYDLALMNPPYEGGQDVAHVEKALALAVRVVAVVRLNFLAGVDRAERIWDRHGLAKLAICSRRPRFGGSSSTAESDFCVVEIRRGWDGPTQIEWWA